MGGSGLEGAFLALVEEGKTEWEVLCPPRLGHWFWVQVSVGERVSWGWCRERPLR